jgi:hypothetical protein
MKNLISIGSVALGSIALNLMPVQQAQAVDLVLNGNFNPATTQTTIVSFGKDAGLAVTPDTTTVTNWVSEGYNFLVPSGTGIADTNTADQNFYGTSFSAPNGAGYYIAADSAYLQGRIYQDLTGLEVGQMYSVSYYQAAAQQTGYTGATTDTWTVHVGQDSDYTAPTYSNANSDDYGTIASGGTFSGGTTHTSPTMSLPSAGNTGTQTTTTGSPKVNGWQQDSFAFTATSATERLSFLAKGTPNGKPPFALLSGVSASKIPEPADYVGTLVGFGFAGLAIKSRLAKKKLDDRN